MIKIHSYPKTRGRRITWLLEELGAEYEFCLVPYGETGFKTEAFLKINPAGKVPAMQDGELTLTESAAIATYLADKYADKGLIPATGTAARGQHDQWCYFVMAELEQPLWTIGKHKFALPAEQRVADIFPTAEWEFQQALKIFADGLGEQAYILGEQFTVADILLCHTLIWATNFGQTIEHDNIKSYQERLSARAALQRAIEKEEAAQEAAAVE